MLPFSPIISRPCAGQYVRHSLHHVLANEVLATQKVSCPNYIFQLQLVVMAVSLWYRHYTSCFSGCQQLLVVINSLVVRPWRLPRMTALSRFYEFVRFNNTQRILAHHSAHLLNDGLYLLVGRTKKFEKKCLGCVCSRRQPLKSFASSTIRSPVEHKTQTLPGEINIKFICCA